MTYSHLTDPNRKGRITASMVGAILGHAPYMTREQAMRSMVRDAIGEPSEFTGNVATDWGNANESNAAFEFEMMTGIPIRASKFITKEDWAGCSPDGLCGDGSGLEIKCPYGIRKDPNPTFKGLDQQPHYYDQVQFSLWVTGWSDWYFFQWTPHGRLLSEVKPSLDWQEINLPKLRQFYAEYLHEAEHNADAYRAPLRQVIDTPEARKMVAEWDDIAEQLELLNERKKDLLDQIVMACNGGNAEFAGRKLTLTKRKGSVSYAKALKDLAPDAGLSKWTGAETEFWSIK